MRQFNIRLDAELYEKFRALCERKERTMTGEVRWLIKQAVDLDEQQR